MDSILTDNKDYCFFCGDPVDCEHHLIFGLSNRNLAELDGIKVPICDHCHTLSKIDEHIHENSMAEKLSKMLGQAVWEKQKVSEGHSLEDARYAFRRRYGKSFL
jgi:NMD protein affecting ribosome stability and mRNA decay